MAIDEAFAQTAHATQVAILCLVKCLKNSGYLNHGQYEEALRSTLDQPDLDQSQLSVRCLRILLAGLERPDHPAPTLSVIKGGKTADGVSTISQSPTACTSTNV
jgi:hypothetical protein